ncbi:L-aspartate oxidase [bacterium]|nr:L-aspartate oxidase [bacterium]
MVPQVLILGTGIAGLSCALKFAGKHPAIRVTLLAKERADEGSTRYAQGGIASVWSKSDSFEQHTRDTLEAGADLCRAEIVRLCVEEGPERIRELISWGVQFTKKGLDPTEEFDLHREGGHSQRRILHADDLTGLEIERALLEQVRSHPNITILENHIAIDLITEGKLFKKWRKPGKCLGAYALDTSSGRVRTLSADITVLATGGAGKVYLYTSNPDVSTGDGIAMAHRAGAQVANLEFMQFHPTCLFHPSAKTFLISEALRGEGAVLKNLQGEAFMARHHSLADLAPRDIVARAIDSEMKRTGDRHVWLDARSVSDAAKKFPNIYETCRDLGIDLTKEPIPVVPAAHYMCGGVLVNENGQTNIDGLYAIGEVACTGLHGANRLASNSLLEAVVFSNRVFLHASLLVERLLEQKHQQAPQLPPIPEWDPGKAVPLEEQIDIAANWFELRNLMWNYVGIVRSDRRLERAARRLELLKEEVNTYYWNFLLTRDLIELRNLLTVAELIVQCALSRKESRGLHFTVDYPGRDASGFSRDTVISGPKA